VTERVRQRAWVSESHVWYELRLEGHRAELPADTRLCRGDARHIPALSALPSHVTPAEAQRRLDDGADLWMAWQGDEPVFACWVFADDAPVAAAPGGTLDLPAETMVVEDVATAYRHHGRGIAPVALAALAAELGRSGSVIAKVEQDNRASRRAFRKAGFRPVAWMHRRERGPLTAVEVEPQRNTRNARFLREALTRS
jgi:RimJ/RimL family protein N-acetyltransferase